jgi:hypothetical protein
LGWSSIPSSTTTSTSGEQEEGEDGKRVLMTVRVLRSGALEASTAPNNVGTPLQVQACVAAGYSLPLALHGLLLKAGIATDSTDDKDDEPQLKPTSKRPSSEIASNTAAARKKKRKTQR